MREFYAYRIQYRPTEGGTLINSGHLFQQFVVDAYTAIEEQRLLWVRQNQEQVRGEVYQGLQDAIESGDHDASSIGQRLILPSSLTGGHRYMTQAFQDAMAIYRPNIVARVFNIKKKQLINDLRKKNHFGRVVADIHVVEFQKRGLPHVHILLTLANEDQIVTAEQIDNFISAELPDKTVEPQLFEIVSKTMIHGPCGLMNPKSPCMVGRACSKKYPKKFNSNTIIDDNGFPVYRRRNNGRSAMIHGQEVDNRWVVRYNRALLIKYSSHINVELCAKTKVIEYLFKYLHKGPDRATVVIEPESSTSMQSNVNSHQNNEKIKQYLDCRYISAPEACWRILEFDLHAQQPFVERLQFHLPNEQYVIFNDKDNLYDIMSRPGIRTSMFIKWMQANNKFKDARSLKYVEFPTAWVWNREEKEWHRRKKKRAIGRLYFAHPSSGERYYLRMLLNIVRGSLNYEDILTINGILYPDFKSACSALGLLEDDSEWHEALEEASVWATSHQLRHLFASILPQSNDQHEFENKSILEELGYDRAAAKIEYRHLTSERLSIFNTILDSCINDAGGFYFVYGSGGTGGRTAHSRFKILLNPPDDSTCMIKPRSELAVLIKKATLIIWDEAPMMHRYAIEAVDRTLKDVLKHTSDGASKFSEAKLLYLERNIRVLQQGMSSTKCNEVTAFANWLLDIGNGSSPTISIDNHSEADWIRIPDDMLIDTYDNGIIQLITIIYPDFLSRLHEDNYLEQRAILATKNDDVDYVNTLMLQMLPGDIRTYLSADSAVNKSNDASTELLTTPEYLNSLNFSGKPKHCLELKVGVPVILLRNLNPAVGLCNGTRLIVLRLERRTIQASIITGTNRNDIHCIPRIVMSPSDREWPFTFKRRQFPLKIAFAMTINKSQGQTLSKVGILLTRPSWNVKCRVKQIFSIHEYNRPHATGRVSTIILADEKKDLIQLTLFNEDLQRYRDLLQEDGFFYINNLASKAVNPAYKIINHDYQLMPTRHTNIVPFDGDTMPVGYNFTPCKTACRSTSHPMGLIDILGILLYVSDIRPVKTKNNTFTLKRDLILIDERLDVDKKLQSYVMRIVSSSSPINGTYYRITATLITVHTDLLFCYNACVLCKRKINLTIDASVLTVAMKAIAQSSATECKSILHFSHDDISIHTDSDHSEVQSGIEEYSTGASQEITRDDALLIANTCKEGEVLASMEGKGKKSTAKLQKEKESLCRLLILTNQKLSIPSNKV
ncbi:uncharacterized protein LOC143878892 [Tasmannia lanceolata]|uniref:uncharacterized protein LOC143878892 n=1 Tax=Tasmannia lanceolata TaxID=3420 RepID=UPI0040649F8F